MKANDKTSTKNKIFNKAVKLFFEKGFHAASMRDIAKDVGIKESTIYYHFKNKDAILDEILEYYVKNFNESLPNETQMKETAEKHKDASELWLEGINAFIKKQPPLMKTVAGILLNEMFLNKKCRNFVLNTMFKIQKEATERLLYDMLKRKLIREIDIKKTALQYVYMLHGLDIEIRLLEKEGKKEKDIMKKYFSAISFFIERLK